MSDTLEKLTAPFDKDAVQRTNGKETRRGYDTTGYGYQWCVDRFNEVMGLDGWGFTYKIIREAEGKYSSGKPFHDITVQIDIWLMDYAPRPCVGGHISASYADALKGAITNAFKKTAAFWGVGSAAYRGQIDDDNQPLPDEHATEGTAAPRKQPPKTPPKQDNSKLIEAIGEVADELSMTDEDREKHEAYVEKYKHNRKALSTFLDRLKVKRDDEKLDAEADKAFVDDDPAQEELY